MKLLLLSILFFACSSESGPLPGRDAAPPASDGSTADTGPGDQEDAGAADAALPDAEPLDAEPPDGELPDGGGEDAEPSDAALPDAADDAGLEDAGLQCGSLGAACTGRDQCDPGQDCTQDTCVPEMRPECGGFVGAMCPPPFPECLYFTGADFGPCYTAAERACICASRQGQTTFACP